MRNGILTGNLTLVCRILWLFATFFVIENSYKIARCLSLGYSKPETSKMLQWIFTDSVYHHKYITTGLWHNVDYFSPFGDCFPFQEKN